MGKKRVLVTVDETTTSGNHKHGMVKVALPAHDADVELVMPNGQTVTAQWRVEGPTLDILLPKRMEVHNWKGDGMIAAPKASKAKKSGHVRKADQLMIPLPEKVLKTLKS